MRYIGALIFLVAMIGVFSACVGMPEITPKGKISIDKEKWVPWWSADEYAEKMMEAEGWERPKQNLDDESDLWLWIAAICAGLAIVCFIAAYFTHQHSLIAVGGILGFCAIVSTIVSALMFWLVLIGGPLLLGVAVYFGWKFRNFNIRHYLARKRSEKRMFNMRSTQE